MGTQKIRQQVVAANLNDSISTKITTPGTGVQINDTLLTVRRARLTLSNFTISVANASDFGGTKLLDLPNRNLMLLGAEVNCTVVKQGNTNGIVAATDITMGIGTAVASASTLSGSMINVIEATAITADTLSVAFQKHSNDQSTASFPLKLADGTASLFMNLTPGNITADSSVTVSGTIDIFYVDLGKLA